MKGISLNKLTDRKCTDWMSEIPQGVVLEGRSRFPSLEHPKVKQHKIGHAPSLRADRKVELMKCKNSGFSMLELVVVIGILGIIAIFAVPQAFTALKAYKLHADAAAVASQLNVTRFRATSQYTPYRVNITTSNGTFNMERLATSYAALSPAQIESGTLYLSSGDSFTTTNPGGSTYPGTITGGSASTVFYFNTRGMPVDSSGNPVANGGAVIYLQNQGALKDAVVVSVGGRISVYNWNNSTSAWIAR